MLAAFLFLLTSQYTVSLNFDGLNVYYYIIAPIGFSSLVIIIILTRCNWYFSQECSHTFFYIGNNNNWHGIILLETIQMPVKCQKCIIISVQDMLQW